jgi:hypothetical protein
MPPHVARPEIDVHSLDFGRYDRIMARMLVNLSETASSQPAAVDMRGPIEAAAAVGAEEHEQEIHDDDDGCKSCL